MTRAASFALALIGLWCVGTSAAADMKIAVVAPDEGAFASLGKQIRDGALFEAEKRGTEIIAFAESCEAGANGNLAKALLAAEVEAAVGFLCSESLETVLPSLAEAGIPAITVSVRSGILMEDAQKNKWPFFRMAPSAKAEADRIVDEISNRWKDKSFALIEDGTIYSRELVETVRVALEEIGMKPVFTDTYRPAQEQQLSLVRRLAKTGASHVFISGDRNDAAIIARDARAEGLSLTLMGGDAMTAANQPVPLTDGVYAVTLPDAVAVADRPVLDRMKQQGLVPEGYVLPALAAVNVLEQARQAQGETGDPLAAALLKAAFPTVLGPIGFAGDHERAENPYRLMVWERTRFVPAEPLRETQ